MLPAIRRHAYTRASRSGKAARRGRFDRQRHSGGRGHEQGLAKAHRPQAIHFGRRRRRFPDQLVNERQPRGAEGARGRSDLDARIAALLWRGRRPLRPLGLACTAAMSAAVRRRLAAAAMSAAREFLRLLGSGGMRWLRPVCSRHEHDAGRGPKDRCSRDDRSHGLRPATELVHRLFHARQIGRTSTMTISGSRQAYNLANVPRPGRVRNFTSLK